VAVLSDLANRLRFEIADMGKSFVHSITADGATNRFLLPYAPVNGTTLEVSVEGVDVSATTEVEELTGYITLDAVPALGDEIIVAGTYYRYFTDSEINNFITTAFSEHTANRTDAFGRTSSLLSLPSIEEYPLVVYASSLALYTLATDASFDINVFAPDGVTIPRSERFQQLMQMVQARKEQYKELCNQLGIGLFKVDVFTLRRISKTTNRYVPVFLPMEVDDKSTPQRAALVMPTYGAQVAPSNVAAYDLVMYEGDSFSAVLDFPYNVTGYTFKSEIRQSPGSAPVLATFTIANVAGQTDKITISLTSAQTARLPEKCYWDIQATSVSDPNYQQTFLRGTVFVTREITE
jgi:hypothetical protein